MCLYKDVEWNWNDKYQVTCVLLPRSALFRNQNTCKRTGRPIQKTLVLSEKIEPPSEKLCSRVCVCVLPFSGVYYVGAIGGGMRRCISNPSLFFFLFSAPIFEQKERNLISAPYYYNTFSLSLSVGKERIPMFENDLFDLVEAAAAVRRKTRPICVRLVERIRG